MSKKDADFVASLQSQIDALQTRVKELEAENAKQLSQLTDCSNHEMEKLHSSDDKHMKSKNGNTQTEEKIQKMPEGQMDPTVESEVFKALEKTRLLVGDRKESQYSRCGRTDKEGEIDYVKVLNRVLPNDIRILGWCPVPVDFRARFSCLSREYKYFFWRENLNIQSAAKKFLGEHDFRHNYRRHITLFEMSPTNVRYGDNLLWVIKIKGSAFLWHQGIDVLLDTNRTSRNPQYIMAAEIPLVLQSCEFEDIRFMCSSDAEEALLLHMVNVCPTYQLQAAIFHEAILNRVSPSDDQSLKHHGGTKKRASHVPLLSRPTEPSYEGGAPDSTQHEDSTNHNFNSRRVLYLVFCGLYK